MLNYSGTHHVITLYYLFLYFYLHTGEFNCFVFQLLISFCHTSFDSLALNLQPLYTFYGDYHENIVLVPVFPSCRRVFFTLSREIIHCFFPPLLTKIESIFGKSTFITDDTIQNSFCNLSLIKTTFSKSTY